MKNENQFAAPSMTSSISSSSIAAAATMTIPQDETEETKTKREPIETKATSKAFNAALLILCFGFAVYSILSVDDGMTRGWSISEKAMRIPLDNWSSYEASLNEQPIATKTTINVVIYLLGDWLSQTLFIRKNLLDFDAWRTLRNGFIGMCFGPLVHEYYEFSDYILPVNVSINRFYKIIMDQTIYIATKCMVYIVAVNVLAGESFEYSAETAKSKIKGVMFTAWKFWPLVHCVTYGAIPARHRILWVNCVDLFWNAILASKTNSEEDDDDKKGEEQNGYVNENEVKALGEGEDMAFRIATNITLEEINSIVLQEENQVIESEVNNFSSLNNNININNKNGINEDDVKELTEVLLASGMKNQTSVVNQISK